MARQIVDEGFIHVRPLLGGFDAWVDRGYPMEMLVAEGQDVEGVGNASHR